MSTETMSKPSELAQKVAYPHPVDLPGCGPPECWSGGGLSGPPPGMIDVLIDLACRNRNLAGELITRMGYPLTDSKTCGNPGTPPAGILGRLASLIPVLQEANEILTRVHNNLDAL